MPFINGKFYMNPAYGRALENARANESTDKDQGGHWVTIDSHHVLIQETKGRRAQQHQAPKPLPDSGQASIYADRFEGKKTANGETFKQNGYTAALLPRSRWHAVRLGTRVELEHDGKSVVVEINDRGAGDNDPESTRVLDLSRAAASALTGRKSKTTMMRSKSGSPSWIR